MRVLSIFSSEKFLKEFLSNPETPYQLLRTSDGRYVRYYPAGQTAEEACSCEERGLEGPERGQFKG